MILYFVCNTFVMVVSKKESVKGELKNMIKIKCIKNYNDKKTKELRKAGSEYIETDARAKEIIAKGFAVLIEEIKEKSQTYKEVEVADKTKGRTYAKKF